MHKRNVRFGRWLAVHYGLRKCLSIWYCSLELFSSEVFSRTKTNDECISCFVHSSNVLRCAVLDIDVDHVLCWPVMFWSKLSVLIFVITMSHF